MRKSLVALVLGLFVCVSSVAPASAGGDTGSDPTLTVSSRLHRHWFQWAFGSSRAPLLDHEFCGEQVGGTFYLTLAGGVNADDKRHIHCDIPSGVPILAPIGGVIVWSNTQTDQEMHHDAFAFLRRLIVRSVHLRLDGVELEHGPVVAPDPYNLHLEPGNLIQTVDPTIEGDSVRIIDGWYFVKLAPLSPGHHVIVASDKFDLRRAGVVQYRTEFSVDVA
jgi:hypothetical protein